MSAILQSPNSDFCFRKMLETDLDEVIRIEESVYPFPGREGFFMTV